MEKLRVIMLVSVVLACSQISWAQEKEKAIPIKEVVVTATRTEREVKDVPASVTVITKEDIEKTSARYLTQILRDVCGIDVYNPQGLTRSTPQRLTMRGIPHQRGNLILLDGIPLNTMYGGDVAFNEVPVENIERIEVVRGATSSLYGSGAMGGVINIITKQPEKEMKNSLEATFGTLKTWNSRATTSGTLKDKFGYFFSFNRLETDGYISTEKEYRKPYTTYRTRDHEDIYTKFTYDIDPTSNISLSYSHWHEKVGGGQINYYGSTERERPTLGYEKKAEKYNLSINTFFLDEDHYWNYNSYVSPYPVKKRNHRDVVDAGAVVSLSMPLGGRHVFTVGTDYRWARIDSRYEWFTTIREQRTRGKQHRGSFFIQDEIKLLGEKFIIIPSARGDWYRTYGGSYYDTTKTPQEVVYNAKTSGAFNPKLGLVYHLTDSTTLYGSIGRSFNAPYLYNLYHQWGYWNKWWEGNPDLGSEYGIQGEWGIKQGFGENLDVKLSGFYNDINDWIGSVYTGKSGSLYMYQYQNISDIVTSGLELEAKYRPFPWLSLYANYNYTHSEIEKFPGKEELEGNWLENIPRHKANFGFTFDDPDIITFSIRQRWVGKRYYDNENEHVLNKYITWDVEFSRNITKYVKASFEVENITNRKWEEYYKDEVPGRMFFGRLKFTY